VNRSLLRGAIPLVTTAALLLTGAHAGAASPGDTVDVPQGSTIELSDGTVLGAGDTTTFSFKGDAPVSRAGGRQALACPEVNDPPSYTVTGSPLFLPDKGKPQSTWLLPRQTVTWSVTGAHTFTWEFSGGVETEAGAILAKAKVKVDTKVSNSWTWSSTQTVSDTNSTSAGYRAVLGQVGWKLTGVKSWYVSPCTLKKKTITVKAPRQGDMSIGRQNS
jgi:hypothetical protein